MWAAGKSPCTWRAARPQRRALPGVSCPWVRKVQWRRVGSIPGDGKEQPSSNGSVSVGPVEPVAAAVASLPTTTAPTATSTEPLTAAPPTPTPGTPTPEAEDEASAEQAPAEAAPAVEASATSAAPDTTSPDSHPLDVQEEEADMFATKELLQELTDTSKLGRRGEGWFVAQLLVFAMVIFPPMKLHGLVDLLSILAISAGVVFLAYGMYSIGRSLSPMPQPRTTGKLITSGMFSYVRHPMYAGLLLVSFGLTFLTGSETRFALSFILWWVLEQKANLEEKLLAEAYPEYAEYKARVHKFFPYLY